MTSPATNSLAAALGRAIAGEVRFDNGSRALYSADASNYRQVPIGVVLPKTVDDIVTAVGICREHAVPILARGGGTSQNGQCVNVAVVIDTSKYLNRVLSIDERAQTALVEPGAICDDLRDAAEHHGLTFGPDPATHSRCTLGGMIGNNSCGARSVMAGKTEENIEALEILTYDGARFWVGSTSDAELRAIIAEGGRRGEIYARLARLRDRYADAIRGKFPKIRRRVSGYNLDQLLPENGFNLARALVGSEGTCAMTLQARAKLVHSPPARVLAVLGYPDIFVAADATLRIMAHSPIALEGLDERIIGGLRDKGWLVADLALLPPGKAWLIVEFGGASAREAKTRAQGLIDELESARDAPSANLVEDDALQNRIWRIRETGASATTTRKGEPDAVVGFEDAAVEPAKLGAYLREFQQLIDRYGYKTSLYGHFGDGCVHSRITFDLRSVGGVAHWRKFLFEAAELVVAHGGSLSGEHGDGQAKGELLPIMYGEELMQAFREFKAIWDPRNKMNPGKLIDAYPVDANLRLGPDYQPLELATHFAFPEDRVTEVGRFARANERCIGMARCRAKKGGAMCPSYRATGEERHSTRGRARLLFEMLQHDVIKDEWRSEEVKAALDLCLACKSCKSECPTGVDIAAYKAEFLAHYYEARRRPRQAYSVARIDRWARLAAHAPRLVNFFAQAPFARNLTKLAAGIAYERPIPRFARESFTRWFARRPPIVARDKPRVMLWPDTFNNYFSPEIAIAAVQVLEAADYGVEVPGEPLCCGRPLYDFGMLDEAKTRLRAIMRALETEIGSGIPIVSLEPSCAAVFRDELLNLFPDDATAAALSRQVILFSDFIDAAGFDLPKQESDALVHVHCHQKALFGTDGVMRALKKSGIDAALLDAGCCGMAGGFGYLHYGTSMKIAELALTPALRAASTETLVIADGYSCREQIVHTTGRRALHTAQVLRAVVLKKR